MIKKNSKNNFKIKVLISLNIKTNKWIRKVKIFFKINKTVENNKIVIVKFKNANKTFKLNNNKILNSRHLILTKFNKIYIMKLKVKEFNGKCIIRIFNNNIIKIIKDNSTLKIKEFIIISIINLINF